MSKLIRALLSPIVALGISFGSLAIGDQGATTAFAAGKKMAKKGPGKCGTYMYWKNRKCMDARAKK